MAKPIMIQGTMSNSGKSLLATGLCRIFSRYGYRTAPFKSQNMALNAGVTAEGLEMGRAQITQAEAAGIEPEAAMNPVLLKPTSDSGSQVIVNGRAVSSMSAREYFRRKRELVPEIMKAYKSLDERFEVIVIEGAGSPVELNLQRDDIVNMGMAELVDAPVLLAGDIDRGGIFAQLWGTVSLLKEEDRARVAGLIVNKFRGDRSLFDEGVKMLEDICQKPVLGVVPYIEAVIDGEDSLADDWNERYTAGADLAVIRLEKISNFTDFKVFEAMPGVSLRYVDSPQKLGRPDCLFLPGSKNTAADAAFLERSGLAREIVRLAREGVPVVGVCGGLQLLGRDIRDPQGTEGGSARGLGLLDTETEFLPQKKLCRRKGRISGAEGVFAPLEGLSYSGYEMHMGRTKGVSDCIFAGNNLMGTYVHGIFDRIASEFVSCVCPSYKGKFDYAAFKASQYDRLADVLEESLDMERICRIMGIEWRETK